MLFDAEGLNHRSIFVKQSQFLFSTSKTMTNIFPSLDRQAWTTTISIEKKHKKNNFLLANSNFEWVAIIVILFSIAKHSLYEQNQNLNKKFSDAQMSHVPLCTSCFSQLFHTGILSWLCQSIAVYIQKICISHNPALPSLRAAVYWSKQNELQDGHTEVSCDWLRWYST